MGVLLPVIAALCGLLLLLAVPVDIAFRFKGAEAFGGQISLRWLFGLLRFRIPVPGARKTPPEPETEPPATRARARRARRAKREKRGGRADILAALRQAAFRQRAYRLLGDLVRAAHPRQLRLWMRLGLGDPADTGRLWAVVGPLSAAAHGLRNVEVGIEPEFMDAVCEFEVQGRFLLIPLQFLALAIAFALSPPSIRAWRSLRASRG